MRLPATAAAAAAAALLVSPPGESAFSGVPFWGSGPVPAEEGPHGAHAGGGEGASAAPEGPPEDKLGFKSVLRFAAPFVGGDEKAESPQGDSGGVAAVTTRTTAAPPPTTTAAATTTTAIPTEATTAFRDEGIGDGGSSSSSSEAPGPPSRLPEHSAFSTGNLLVLSSCLLLCFFFGYLSHTQKIRHLPDSAGAMLVGGIFGLLIRMYAQFTDIPENGTGDLGLQSTAPFSYHLPVATPGASKAGASAAALTGLYFDPHFFYIVLLPPIVLDAGLSVSQYDFLRNGAPILLFAFAGTLTSTLLIYVGLHAANEHLADVGLQGPPHKVRAFLWAFAALISATDTVAIMNLLNSPRFFTRTRENRLVHSKSLARYGGQQVVRGGGELVYASTSAACPPPSSSPYGGTGPHQRRGREVQEIHSVATQDSSPAESPRSCQPLAEGRMSSNNGASSTEAVSPPLPEETHQPSLPRMHSTLVSSNLVSILMGESILNDAVSIALTRSVFKFCFSDDKDVILNVGVGDVRSPYAAGLAVAAAAHGRALARQLLAALLLLML